MKIHVSSFLLWLTACALPAATFTAAPVSNPTQSIAYSVRVVDFDQNGTTIGRGTTKMTVLRLLGASYRQLSNDSWMYHGFSPSYAPAKEQSCDQLVITFANGKVAEINLVNRGAALLLAKGVALNPLGSVVVTK